MESVSRWKKIPSRASMSELLLRSVRPWGGMLTDLRIREGRIHESGNGLAAGPDAEVVDGGGALALPGLVNAHTHLDKSLWGMRWQPHRAGPTVAERIAGEQRLLSQLDFCPQRQSLRLAREMVAWGTTHVRTHVDVSPTVGLAHLHGVQRTAELLDGILDVEIVAFPQDGVMRRPGTVDLLARALDEGAQVLGGIDPVSIDRDPKGQLDALFDLAGSRGVGIDVHLHDAGEMGAVTVEMIAERTRATGLNGKVVISHAFCLGSVPAPRLAGLLDLLVAQDIAVMTHGPGGGTPVPPLRLLHEHGVRVFCGTDGVRDAWGPLNGPDMLQRAYLIAYLNGLRDDAGLELVMDMATRAGAQVMGVADHGLESGCAADVVLLDASCVAEAVVAHPPRTLVLRRGNVVARNGRCVVPGVE